jgi:asparagine synthase (glutamine-hydrolysing)
MPGEETLLKNIRKLAPGSTMLVKNGNANIKQYWDLHFAPKEIGIAQAERQLIELFDECVRMHMIADVPVGFLLSGGVDSTAMLGFAVGKTDRPLSTFTLGFSDPGVIDERPYAQLAAKRYNANHHEMTISSKEFADFIPKYSWHMEEPCCEPQAVALYYVSRLAKDYVKVLISGEGGDEAFAGYSVYRNMLWLERVKSAIGPLKGFLSSGISLVNHFVKSKRMAKYPSMVDLPIESYYYSRTSGPASFFNSHAAELYSKDFARQVDKQFSIGPATSCFTSTVGNGNSPVNRMLYVDSRTSLPDDLLLKADKMTMANSIELRVPLLDHKLLEFAASLPENFKVHGFTTKYLVKMALKNRLPKEIMERKKVGFPVPYDTWMRTELKDWVRDILLDRESMSRGYFDKKCIENLIAEDIRTHRYPKEILSLVALELWHRNFLEDKPIENPHRSLNPVVSS